MARIRTIKPDTFTSDDVNALPIAARWTFVGLWCYVDDKGRGRADPRLVKAAVWPIDDSITATDVAQHLDEMEKRYMICRYEADGVTFMHVTNFNAHQRINRETESKLPPCSRDTHGGMPDPSPIDPPPFTEDSVRDQGKVTEESHPRARAPEVEQGTGNREQGSGTGIAATPRSAPAPLDGPLSGEIVTAEPPEASTAVVPATAAALEPVNGGTITRAWIDHCAASGVRLPKNLIGRYGKAIKAALDQHFDSATIRRALGQMLADGEASHPHLFENYLVRAQHGPARRPRRLTPGEESADRILQAAGEHSAEVIDLFRGMLGESA